MPGTTELQDFLRDWRDYHLQRTRLLISACTETLVIPT